MIDGWWSFRNITDSICQAAGFSPKIAFEVDGILMEEMLELERGIVLLPLYLIKRKHFGTRNLSMLKIEEPDTHISIGMSWLKSKYLSHTARCFRDYLIENNISKYPCLDLYFFNVAVQLNLMTGM